MLLGYFSVISHELYQNDENIFEIYVKDWFRHGSQRFKKETTTGNIYIYYDTHTIMLPYLLYYIAVVFNVRHP